MKFTFFFSDNEIPNCLFCSALNVSISTMMFTNLHLRCFDLSISSFKLALKKEFEI